MVLSVHGEQFTPLWWLANRKEPEAAYTAGWRCECWLASYLVLWLVLSPPVGEYEPGSVDGLIIGDRLRARRWRRA